MADDEQEESVSLDYGGEEPYLSPQEIEYARMKGEVKSLEQKHAYEQSPQGKVRKYVTPMRSFTKDVLGFVKKIPRYEEEAKKQYSEVERQLKSAVEEEKKIEQDIGQAFSSEATSHETPKEDWSMGFGHGKSEPEHKYEPEHKIAKKPRKEWDMGFDNMKF
jgi:hypothetical protein